MHYEVKCITKSHRLDPHERILWLGGVYSGNLPWKFSQQDVVRLIEAGDSFKVTRGGHSVKLIVAKSNYGNKYVKTEADGEQPNNLLSLPECIG